jgi:hypothetical protein
MDDVLLADLVHEEPFPEAIIVIDLLLVWFGFRRFDTKVLANARLRVGFELLNSIEYLCLEFSDPVVSGSLLLAGSLPFSAGLFPHGSTIKIISISSILCTYRKKRISGPKINRFSDKIDTSEPCRHILEFQRQ